MAEQKVYYDTSRIEGDSLAQAVDDMKNSASSARRSFEKRWFDNNLFDDGKHFSYVSRQQNKIVDLNLKSNRQLQLRAIPKASRQIRGVANLLNSNDFVPIIYPEKIDRKMYGETPVLDDMGQPMLNPLTQQPLTIYDLKNEESRLIATRSGTWILEEFKAQDLITKLSLMTILAAKHGISYLQIIADSNKEMIKTVVRDAFDVFLIGEVNELEDSPFVSIMHPKSVAEIKADRRFDEKQREKINPDNRHASSEIKEAYMITRFGRAFRDDRSATLIEKETYVREYLNDDNRKRIAKQENSSDILEGKEDGDPVVRQIISAGNIHLHDEYMEAPYYPLVDLRLEPGALYQVPMIERFIPQNKSLDVIVSRVEKQINTMTVGTWLKREGEQVNLSNLEGGQVVEYKNIAPQQAQMAPIPAHVFNFMGLLNSFIEEQGVTTTTLGKIPAGVKAASAIESLKESEYANLVIASRMMKQTVKKIAERMLDLADRYYVNKKTVFYRDRGNPENFDVIGKSAMSKRKKLKVPVEDGVVPLSGESRVEIEIQSGMAYTKEGQKQSAMQLANYLLQLTQMGVLPPQSMTKYLEVLLQAFQYGPTADFIRDVELFQQQGQVTDPQMQKMQLAMAQVLKDSGVGQQNPEQDIQKAKIGAAEALRDANKGGAK